MLSLAQGQTEAKVMVKPILTVGQQKSSKIGQAFDCQWVVAYRHGQTVQNRWDYWNSVDSLP